LQERGPLRFQQRLFDRSFRFDNADNEAESAFRQRKTEQHGSLHLFIYHSNDSNLSIANEETCLPFPVSDNRP
jgi:hypothetical protein